MPFEPTEKHEEDIVPESSDDSVTVLEHVVGRVNPFYVGRLAKAKILEAALAVTMIPSNHTRKLVEVDTVEILDLLRPKFAERILEKSNHDDVIRANRSIINMAVADPFRLEVDRGFVMSKDQDSVAIASLTGVTSAFHNDGRCPSHICVQPFFHSWPRFCAVIKQVFRTNVLFFNSCSNGIVFVTGGERTGGPKIIRIGGKIYARADSDIPPMGKKISVYDGRRTFHPAKYWLKKYDEDVRPGSAVLLLFSIQKMRLPYEAQGFEFSTSMTGVRLNAHAVVVLEEPSSEFWLGLAPNPASAQGIKGRIRLTVLNLEDFQTEGTENNDDGENTREEI